ncbi:M24 family metallopeptidase [Dissulfurispira sp.]|uniref:M24 family metallopeptidase n=1 Tax=Dissulfurispira sp. TaxID=2817609 RepID=UPI002FD88FB9
MIQSRKKDIQRILGLKGLDAFLITNMKNIRYLTGFTGSSGFAIITRDRGLFFTDFRYQEQSKKEIKDFEIAIEKGKRIKLIRSFVKKLGIKKLGFEKSISYEFYELLKGVPAALLPQKNLVEDMRKIKSEEEIGSIKEAVRRAEGAFLKIKPRIKPGAKEREIALRLEEQLKKAGCGNIPFDIIVASGKNSSMPHARPTEKKIEKGDFVIIDWGGEANGYCSDMTRTLLMNCKDLDKKIRVYNTVNYARQKAIKSIREGLKTQETDSTARNAIKKAGYGEFFGHGTGHGVGLDVHEYPHVSWNKGEKIRNNMVFTVEPGIYIPELGGVRIEDMVLVRNGKAELLTGLSRELEIVK